MKQFILLALASSLFFMCKEKDGTGTVWVNAYKVECTGVAPMQCLQISKTDSPYEWEYFYSSIQGFKFEEGIIQKIKVKKETIENPPADASNIKYTLMEVIETKQANKNRLHDIWALETIGGKSHTEFKGTRPTLEIKSAAGQFSGESGCNRFSGTFDELTENTMKFGNAATTRMACRPGTAEREVLDVLNNVRSYSFSDLNLSLLDADGNTLAVYKKVD